MRFMIGICQGGCFLIITILSTESVGPKYHARVMSYITISQSVASILLGVHAWFIHNWEYLQLFTSIPYLIGLIAYR